MQSSMCKNQIKSNTRGCVHDGLQVVNHTNYPIICVFFHFFYSLFSYFCMYFFSFFLIQITPPAVTLHMETNSDTWSHQFQFILNSNFFLFTQCLFRNIPTSSSQSLKLKWEKKRNTVSDHLTTRRL